MVAESISSENDDPVLDFAKERRRRRMFTAEAAFHEGAEAVIEGRAKQEHIDKRWLAHTARKGRLDEEEIRRIAELVRQELLEEEHPPKAD